MYISVLNKTFYRRKKMAKCSNPNCKCEDCQCGDNCQCGKDGKKCLCGNNCRCSKDNKSSEPYHCSESK